MPVNGFPRILLVTSSVFNPYSGGGVTLTNLFRGWPGDRIAAIHSDSTPPDTQVCQRFYHLTNADVRTMWPLAELGALRRAARAAIRSSNSRADGSLPPRQNPVCISEKRGGLRQWFAEQVVGDGLPMRVGLSPALDAFIRDFRPELIYTFLGDLPYMRLVEAILKSYSVPLVVHLMDDWPNVIYQRGWFGLPLRLQTHRLLSNLLNRATVRMGISQAMCRAYEEDYGLPFVPFHNAIAIGDWPRPRRRKRASGQPFRLIYSGSIMPSAQLDSLRDMCEAVWNLHRSGVPVKLNIHAPSYAAHYRQQLERPPAAAFAPPPEDDGGIRSVLTDADLLVLPVNFDADSVRYIRYSMPTKIPAYLASGRPVLVYGPRGTTQVDYADQEGWGYVVGKPGVAGLEAAIRTLMADDDLRARIGRRGAELARQRHDARTVRPAFQAALRRAAKRQAGSAS